MRGLPTRIQTSDDLNNLFEMSRDGKIDSAGLAERIQELLARQYHRVPILEVNGTMVKTFYFPEVSVGDVTADGLTVKTVKHIEDEGAEEIQFAFSEITLSKKVASETTTLTVVKSVNPLVEDGFDVEKINYILGVLTDA